MKHRGLKDLIFNLSTFNRSVVLRLPNVSGQIISFEIENVLLLCIKAFYAFESILNEIKFASLLSNFTFSLLKRNNLTNRNTPLKNSIYACGLTFKRRINAGLSLESVKSGYLPYRYFTAVGKWIEVFLDFR